MGAALDRIDLFRIFIRVVDCASFTRAAATLGVPRSSVSAAVRELEIRIGTRLLHRTTRHVSTTHDGLAFMSAANASLLMSRRPKISFVKSARSRQARSVSMFPVE